jgi:hypothetical protein
VGADKYSIIHDYKHHNKALDDRVVGGHVQDKSKRRSVNHEVQLKSLEHDGPKYKAVDLVSIQFCSLTFYFRPALKNLVKVL